MIRNFGPVFVSRGVVQLSAYIDSIIASWLPTGAVSALAYAQTLYLLPVSLFGMSVSASELPEMSSALGGREEVAAHLRRRLVSGLRRIAFFVIPSVVAFIALGDIIAAAIYQRGKIHAYRRASMSGEFWPARASDCSRPLRAGSIHRPSTP